MENHSDLNSEKKRGRPKGSKNKSPGFKHYKPKKWEPWMTQLVLTKLATDISNKDLAAQYEISEGHVSNLLSCEQAHSIREKLESHVRSKSEDIGDRLAKLRDLSLDVMESFMQRDDLRQNAPVAFVREAKDIFKMTFPVSNSENEKGSTTINQTNNNILLANPEFMERLARGIEGSNEIAAIHNETRQRLLNAGLDPAKEVKTELKVANG